MPHTGGLETLTAHVGLWRIGEKKSKRYVAMVGLYRCFGRRRHPSRSNSDF